MDPSRLPRGRGRNCGRRDAAPQRPRSNGMLTLAASRSRASGSSSRSSVSRRARCRRGGVHRLARRADGGRPRRRLSGPIAADDVVLFDLFPRDRESACYSDFTRTVAVGTGLDELREYTAREEALDLAVAAVKPGVKGSDIHRQVCDFFHEHGHKTQLHKEEGESLVDGYFHATGHGVGLEVHERRARPRRERAARRRRRDRARARPPTGRLRRRPARGSRPRHRGRRRGADRLPVRARAERAHDQTILVEERRTAAARLRRARGRAAGHLRARLRGVLGERGPRARHWFEPFTSLYEWELPYAKWYLGGKLNVAYNCVDRHVEAGLGDRVAYHWEGEPEGEAHDHLRRPAGRGRPLRERAQGARRRQGDEGRDLHGHGPGAAGRDARLHAPRRAAHGRLRRLLGRLALRPGQRHGLHGARHAGRGLAPRHDRAC